MPIQIIITGNDASEAMQHMASFIGMRGLDPREPQVGEAQIDKAVGNGASGEVTAEAPAKPKGRAGRPKKEPEPQPEQQTAADTAAQDDADEAQREPVAATVDDVRAALNDLYVKRFGMDATQADIAKLYTMRFPDGTVTKATEIPPHMRAQVIEDIAEMATKNPFKRKDITL